MKDGQNIENCGAQLDLGVKCRIPAPSSRALVRDVRGVLSHREARIPFMLVVETDNGEIWGFAPEALNYFRKNS